MGEIHTALQLGRSLLVLLFHQSRFPEPRPSRWSWCVFCRCLMTLRPDILRTRWSSRPDTVFLLESWQLLIDLVRGKMHTAPGFHLCQSRCCFWRRCCSCDCWIHNAPLRLFRNLELHWRSFSTVEPQTRTGSYCRYPADCGATLLCILRHMQMHQLHFNT